MPRVVLPLAVYLHTQLGRCTGISFIDSTSLSIRKNARIAQRQVFRVDARQLAHCGKTLVAWFYGFTPHLMIKDQGELRALCLTPANLDDRRPVPRLARRLFGKLIGDRAYLSQPLAEQGWVRNGVGA